MEQEDLRYQFGPFTLDVHSGLLTGPAGEIKLRPQAFRVLQYLVEQQARIVPRDELLDEVWGSEHLSANSLPQVISELRHALEDDSRRPDYIATVHRRGYRFVAEVQASRVAPVAPQAIGLGETPVPPPASANASRRRPTPSMVIAVCVAGLVLITLPWWLRGPAGNGANDGITAGRRLMVLPLHHAAQNAPTEWLSIALADALGDELRKSRALRVLSARRVARMQVDLELAVSESLPAGTLTRVVERTGARWVVSGAVSPLEGSGALRLALKVTDTTTQAVAATHVSEFAIDDWSDAVSHAAADLRQGLGLPAPDALRSGLVVRAPPTALAASSDYHTALFALRRFDLATALAKLTRAREADPTSAWVHSALARVYEARGETTLARTHAERAVEHAQSLGESDQRPLRAHALRLANQPGAAAELYGDAQVDTGELCFGLERARALSAAGQGENALAYLDELRAQTAAPSDLLLIALEFAAIAETIGEFARQRGAAEQAVAIASEIGAQWHEAHGRRLLGVAQLRLGDAQRASALLSRAFNMLQLLDDLPGASRASAGWAQALMDTGALDLARAKLEQALEFAQRIGHAGLVAEHTSHLGALALSAGEGDRANALLADALAGFDAIGDRRGEAQARLRLADAVARAGEFERGLELMRESRRLFQEVGDLHGEARAWDMLGAMLGRSGSLDAARHFERALELYRESGDRRGEADALGHLGSQYSARGQFEPAVRHMSEALELYQRIPSKRGAAKVMYNLSLIHLKTGAVAESARLLAAAHRTFEALDLTMNAAWVQRKHGDVLMHQGELREARKALDSALMSAREAGARAAIAHALSSLGDLALYEGDRVGAVALHEEARDMRVEMRQLGNAAANEMALVRMALDRGDLREAERGLAAAAAALETNAQGWRSVVLAMQARLDAARGLPELARTSLSRASAALEASGSQDAAMRLQLDLEVGRTLGALGDYDAAEAHLVSVFDTASRFGFVARALEASLARLDVLADAGTDADAQPQLRSLAREAQAAGFIAIAERAVALARVAEANAGPGEAPGAVD